MKIELILSLAALIVSVAAFVVAAKKKPVPGEKGDKGDPGQDGLPGKNGKDGDGVYYVGKAVEIRNIDNKVMTKFEKPLIKEQ